MTEDLAQALSRVRRAGPVLGRDAMRELGSYGVPLIEAVQPWLDDPALARLAVLGMAAAGESGARPEARAALLDVTDRAVSTAVRDDAMYYLSKLTESGLGKYIAPYSTWHAVVDEILRPDATHWYLTACRHWNTEGWITRQGRRHRATVSASELCPLCDGADSRVVEQPPEWAFHRVTTGGAARLYLQGERSLHYAVEDTSFQTHHDQTVYLTRCGWWVPSALFTGRSQGGKVPATCENCASSSDGQPPETF